MADVWLGLCTDNAQEDLRRALLSMSRDARITFASSAEDLRRRVSDATQSVGAMVGPLDGGVSSVNLAAALVADGMASEVVLVAPGVSRGLAERAERAGVSRVVDLSSLILAPIDDLDEPYDDIGDMPTMVIDASGAFAAPRPRPGRQGVGLAGGKPARLRSLPLVDTTPASGVQEQVPDATLVVSEAFVPTSGKEVLAYASDDKLLGVPEPAGGVRHREAEAQADDAQAQEAVVRVSVDARPSEGKPQASEGRAPLIALVSGRGGVGKTSVVAAMALAAQSWGMHVAALDLDLACGNLYSCFGMGEVADLASVPLLAEGPAQDLVGLGRDAAQGITLWGPCELPEMAESVWPHVGRLLSCLREASDLVLVDTSATFTDAVAQAAQACDRLVIVVDNRPGSTVAQARLAALAVRLGVARTRIVRLANRCGPHGRGEPVINRAEVGLETARTFRVADGGPEVSDCLAEGRVQDLRDLGSRFYTSAGTALATMLSELGCLPQTPEARKALESGLEKPRWSFGLRREVG